MHLKMIVEKEGRIVKTSFFGRVGVNLTFLGCRCLLEETTKPRGFLRAISQSFRMGHFWCFERCPRFDCQRNPWDPKKDGLLFSRCKPIWLPIKAHRFAAYRAKAVSASTTGVQWPVYEFV